MSIAHRRRTLALAAALRLAQELWFWVAQRFQRCDKRLFFTAALAAAVPLLIFTAVLVAAAPPNSPLPATQETSAPQRSSSPAARAFAERRTIPGISNVGEVTPSLFRGAQPSPKGFQALAKLGVDIVVDARSGDRNKSEGEQIRKLGMRYVAIPWHCPFPHDAVFAQFLKLLKDNPGKKVFLHCRLGDDRTGMMIAAFRMAEQGWSAHDAMLEMEQFGFTRPHHFICPRLATYEATFPDRLKTDPLFNGLH